MKILLAISHLKTGGAERVITLMSNHWAGKGYRVHLLTFAKSTNPCSYPLNENVKRVSPQDLYNIFPGKLGHLCSLRKLIKRISPDIIISFSDETNIIMLTALMGTKFPIIIAERSNPEYQKLPFIYSLFRKTIYSMADIIVLQTKGVGKWFSDRGYSCRREVIPNPIPIQDNRNDLEEESRQLTGQFVVTVGRLSKEKGHDRLLKVFEKVRKNYPDLKLVIVGDGPERDNLCELISRLGLDDSVILYGISKNPSMIIKKASLFVFTSHYEGFPNALCEAMVAGLPVVSFDCPFGPSDIIDNGVNGLLIENGDLDAFSDAINSLMSSSEKRKALGVEAAKISNKFAIDSICRQWEFLISEIACDKY